MESTTISQIYQGNRLQIVEAKEMIEQATQAEKIYEVISLIFDKSGIEDVSNFLSFKDKKTSIKIKTLICNQLATMDKGTRILYRINLLVQHKLKINSDSVFPLSELRFSPKDEKINDGKTLISLIKDSKIPDLSDKELNKLTSASYLPKFLKEFSKLASASQLTLDRLLFHAIEAKKPNILRYLVHVGANTNAVDNNYTSPALKAISLIKSSNFEESFSVLSALLENRQRLQEADALNILDFCCQNYRKDETQDALIFNLGLFDHAISNLLGYKIKTADYYEGDRRLINKFIAHVNGIKGRSVSVTKMAEAEAKAKAEANEKALAKAKKKKEKMYLDETNSYTLTGMRKKAYLQLRLLLLIQIMVEGIMKGIFNRNELSSLYKEFISEIETAWITQLLDAWRYSPNSSNEEGTQQFCQKLSKYVSKQIYQLNDLEEYPLFLGWPGHSICVVFAREKNFLTIRVDNLGSGYSANHLVEEKFVYSKLVTKFSVNWTSVKEKPQPSASGLMEYLTSLFMNIAHKIVLDDEKKELLIKRVYSPENIFTLLDTKSSKNRPKHPPQNIGNCTYASFSVGVRNRLGNTLFKHVLDREVGKLTSINDSYTNNPTSFLDKLSELPAIQNESAEPFFQRLRKTLEETYERIIPSTDFPYIMNASIGENTSLPHAKKSQSLCDMIAGLFKSTNHSTKQPITQIKLEGHAGIGKTILSRQLCQQWLSHSNSNGIAIYLSLRNLSNEQKYLYIEGYEYDLIDIIDSELLKPINGCSLNDIERRLLQHKISKNEVLWVLDGLDELNVLPQLKKSIEILLKKNKLVVTSRPEIEIPGIELEPMPNLYLEKYDDIEIDQFIENYFSKELFSGGHEDPALSINKIKKALKANDQLKTICSIPITLDIICRSIKEGNEKILGQKNLAEIYHDFINQAKNKAYERRANAARIEPNYMKMGEREKAAWIIEQQDKAIKFVQLLAYETLKNKRSLISSKKSIDKCLEPCKIEPNSADHRYLYENLDAIGLVKISDLGAEFIHASFQEYFLALNLIKSLKKSTTSSHQNAQAFIEEHKFDLNYQNVFLLVVHEFIRQLTETKNKEKKEQFIALLESFLSQFTQPNEVVMDEKSKYIPNSKNPINIYPQGIALLDVYSKCIQSKLVKEEAFINNYLPFINQAFEWLIADFSTDRVKFDLTRSFIPSLNPFSCGLATFSPLLNTVPSLKEKERLNVIPRLIEHISQNLKKANPSNTVWNALFFIDSIKGLDAGILAEISSLILNLTRWKINTSLSKGIIELSMNHVEKLLIEKTQKEEVLSEEDRSGMKKIMDLISEHLDFLGSIEILGMEKLISFSSFLKKHESPNNLLSQLDILTIKMFSWESTEEIASCWEKLKTEELINLKTLFTETKLRRMLARPHIDSFKDKINHLCNRAATTDNQNNRKGLYRANQFYQLRFALKSLDFIDLIDPSFGTKLIEKIIDILRSGGCVTKPYKHVCRYEASLALIEYEPDQFPGDYKIALSRFKDIIEVVNRHINWSDLEDRAYYLEKNKRILAWLRKLTRDEDDSWEINKINNLIKKIESRIEQLSKS